jgi:hypothetical protein
MTKLACNDADAKEFEKNNNGKISLASDADAERIEEKYNTDKVRPGQ